MNIAIVFAGGSGKRMNLNSRPKQFLEFRGKPIIIYTLELFNSHPEIDGIVVACIEDWIPYLLTLLKKFNIDKVRAVVPGGKTGQDSIYNALEEAATFADDDSIVLIHDGVRPLINEKTISDNIECVRKNGTCITSTPATETSIIRRSDGNLDIPPRQETKIARAPQSFVLKDILRVHRKAIEDGCHDFIDCCSMMNHYGHTIHTVDGPVENIKITTPTDYFIFKALVDTQQYRDIYGF